MIKCLMIAASIISVAAPAFADKMDCDARYTDSQTKIMTSKSMAPVRRVAMSRLALQAYDFCSAGDEDTAKKYFDMMSRDSN